MKRTYDSLQITEKKGTLKYFYTINVRIARVKSHKFSSLKLRSHVIIRVYRRPSRSTDYINDLTFLPGKHLFLLYLYVNLPLNASRNSGAAGKKKAEENLKVARLRNSIDCIYNMVPRSLRDNGLLYLRIASQIVYCSNARLPMCVDAHACSLNDSLIRDYSYQ